MKQEKTGFLESSGIQTTPSWGISALADVQTQSRYCSFAAAHLLFSFIYRFPLQPQLPAHSWNYDFSLWHCSLIISRQQLKDAACPRECKMKLCCRWCSVFGTKVGWEESLTKLLTLDFIEADFRFSKACLSCGPGYLLEKCAICMQAPED